MTKEFLHQKLRVAVLMGGKSIEREVSFNSGRTICDHLDSVKFDIIPIFQKDNGNLYLLPWHFIHRGKISDFYNRLDKEAKKIIWDDLKDLVDFVYLALHGRYGEDGTVQGILEILDIPYLGAKVFGSSLIMDKIKQKAFFKSNDINVAKDLIIRANDIKNFSIKKVLEKLKNAGINLPFIVKPFHEGSSIGISVVRNEDEILTSINKAAFCTSGVVQEVLIEEKLEGMEFVTVCLQQKNGEWKPLSVTEVILEKDYDFYDYGQKYMPGRATKITPARCSKENFQRILNTCLKVTKVLNFSAISRIDGFLTKDDKIYIIDPNTITGMAPATFLFHQAAEIGMNHTQLINHMIDTELNNYGIKNMSLKRNAKNINKKIENKNRVAVLLGGDTNEREISLESGRNICYKLSPNKYDVIPIFVNDKKELYKLSTRLLIQNSTKEISQLINKDLQIKWSYLPQICDFVFIGLHGGIGENGSVQGILEMLDLPYNGSGVFTSSLCMDKFKTAQFLKSYKFDVPNSFLLEKSDWIKNKKKCATFINGLRFPLIVKPHDDGCSFFVKKVKDEKEFLEILNIYFEESQKDNILIEELVAGMELTCGVIGNDNVIVMPPSKVLVTKDILSIEEKFLPGAGENLTPAPLSKDALSFIQSKIADVYKILGCSGYARIDCFYQNANESSTKTQRLVILEVNSLPGMTPATCLFHQAAEIGLRPMDFIDKIIELGLEKHRKIIKKEKKNVLLSKVSTINKAKENNQNKIFTEKTESIF